MSALVDSAIYGKRPIPAGYKVCADCKGEGLVGPDGSACNCAKYGLTPGFERIRGPAEAPRSHALTPQCSRCDAGDRAEPDADLRRVLVELADAADAVERHEHDYPFAQVMCVGPRGVYVWCDTPTGRAAEADYKVVGHRYAKARLDVLAHARRVRATRGA